MIVQFVFFPYSLNGEPCADAFVSERINVCQDNFHHFNTALAFVIKYICAVEKKDTIRIISHSSIQNLQVKKSFKVMTDEEVLESFKEQTDRELEQLREGEERLKTQLREAEEENQEN